MESWRHAWRQGFLPQFELHHLLVLRDALRADDWRLGQGFTTKPPPLACVQDWSCEEACPVAWCGWRGDRLRDVAEVEEFFARTCFRADELLGEAAGCRWFLNFWDDTPREEAVPALLAEVELALGHLTEVKPCLATTP